MPKPPHERLTPLETIIMDAVWSLEEATVRETREHLRESRPMAYNTVLTVMRILRDKGFLASRREGRTDVYQPLVSREQIGKRSLGELRDRFFSGSAAALVSQLLDADSLTDGEIREVRAEVDRKLSSEQRGIPE